MNVLLLRFALLFCPREFREEYRDQIAGFARHNTAAALFDIVHAGLVLHAENQARDFGFALRTLRKAPLFTVVATLAIVDPFAFALVLVLLVAATAVAAIAPAWRAMRAEPSVAL